MLTAPDGIRSAMYGEMAASAAGLRPWIISQGEWEAAMEGAIRFILTSGFDQRTSHLLLREAVDTHQAAEANHLDETGSEICERLAAEFRWQIQNR